MTNLQKKLYEISDSEYAAFQAKLTPTVSKDKFIGVRLPVLRKFAKEFSKSEESSLFMSKLPHDTYDENLLHSILISQIKDFDVTVEELEKFLPYVDNWAVCDTMHPKAFIKRKNDILPYIKKWINSEHTYICRFGIDMLMTHFLDEDFKPEYLQLPAEVISEEYYVRMMVAWYFATALAKQWDDTVIYITDRKLPEWTHKKTIQKACESYRITDKQKEFLKTFR